MERCFKQGHNLTRQIRRCRNQESSLVITKSVKKAEKFESGLLAIIKCILHNGYNCRQKRRKNHEFQPFQRIDKK